MMRPMLISLNHPTTWLTLLSVVIATALNLTLPDSGITFLALALASLASIGSILLSIALYFQLRRTAKELPYALPERREYLEKSLRSL